MSRSAFDLRVYLVVGESDLRHGRSLEDTVAAAVHGGVTLVQLRDKSADSHRFVELGRALRALLDAAGVPLIINDRVAEMQAIGASGLHVGQEDLPAAAARERIGPACLLGLSVSRPEEAADLPPGLVDYLGVGPIHATGTKADAKAPIGPEGLAAVRRVTSLPLVGIGGLTAERAPAVIAAGAQGVAVVSAICGAEDPAAAARAIRAGVDAARHR